MKFIKAFESFNESELDVETIIDGFIDISDNYDLEKINYDTFVDYITKASAEPGDFHNSYLITNTSNEKDSRLLFAILIKSKKDNFGKIKINGENAKKIFNSEYPDMYKEVLDFISFVENVTKCKVFWYMFGENFENFCYYHISIQFSLEGQRWVDDNGYLKNKFKDLNEGEIQKEIDAESLLDAFYDIKDEFSLELHNFSFLNNGYLFVREDIWPGNGYSYAYREPSNMNSKHYDDRRGKFYLSIYLKSKSLTKPSTQISTLFDKRVGDSEREKNAETYMQKDYPGFRKMCEEYADQVKNICKGQKTEFRYKASTIELRDFVIYEVRLSFSIWTPLFHETPHGRTLNMLKTIDLDDDMKSKLKDLGYNI